MILVVGLGNFGEKYKFTRHNAGFLAVDSIIDSYNLQKTNNKFQSLVYEGSVEGNKIIALKPQTLMNLSGNAVSLAKKFYKLENEQILVLHDDIDLKFGKLSFKNKGSHRGHNGLKDLHNKIGDGYFRVGIGVDRPIEKSMVTNYVLGNFAKQEFEIVLESIAKITDNFDYFLQKDYELFTNSIKK